MRYVLLVVTALLVSCASPIAWVSHIKARITTPSSTVEQVGNAAVPATSTVTTTKTEMPIPTGSTITIQTPSTPVMSAPISVLPTLSTTTISEHITAPTAFTPPLPPTPSAVADANLRVGFWIGLVVGTACALFGLVRLWNLVMWGGICVAGACAFALFVQTSPWVFVVIGIGVALKFAGPYLYHTYIKPAQLPTPPSQ